MKKSLIGLSAMLLIAGSIGTAGALTLTDTKMFTPAGMNQDYVKHEWGFIDYVTWNHFFTIDYDAYVINYATLELKYKNDEKKGFDFLYGEGGIFEFGEIDKTYDIGVNSLYDGIYHVQVLSFGDFNLNESILTIDYDFVNQEPVPEPATMLLMGLGLTGIIVAHRRKAKKA